MIPILNLSDSGQRARVETLWRELRLDPAQLALAGGRYAAEARAVEGIIADVAERGDAAIVDSARKFDFDQFTAEMIRVSPKEMKEAAGNVPGELMAALRRSIDQVREYQLHILPE